jgi:hypothetical protein
MLAPKARWSNLPHQNEIVSHIAGCATCFHLAAVIIFNIGEFWAGVNWVQVEEPQMRSLVRHGIQLRNGPGSRMPVHFSS